MKHAAPPPTLGMLAPAPYNPRKISGDQAKRLARSLAVFGDLSGIVFNRRTQRLIGGHQRVAQLPEDAMVVVDRLDAPNAQGTVATGYVEVEGERYAYREVDVDESTEAAMNVAANKHGGEWDLPKLAEVLGDLAEHSFDMELTGFSGAELETLFASSALPAAGDAETESVPESFMVMIECASEREQLAVIERLSADGLRCRALIS